MNRLREKYIYVRNPMNTKQISKIPVSSDFVECIVFWSKNPKPLISYLPEIDKLGYSYYFQFTVTSYDTSLESCVPKKTEIIQTFKTLSEMIGKEKVIWRYDPIILTDVFTKEYHFKWFEYLADELKDYTDKCVISFVDSYEKTKRNMKNIKTVGITSEDIEEICCRLAETVKDKNIQLETCAHDFDVNKYGIKHSKCVDDFLISRITNNIFDIPKDIMQRNECGCVESRDIGSYNTCLHKCLYCYANFNNGIVEKNSKAHDPNSPLLFGVLSGDETISEYKPKIFRSSSVSWEKFV